MKMKNNKKYPLFDIYWDKDDIKAVSDIIKRGSHWAIGPEIEIFEKMLARYLLSKYAVTFNSGTSALYSVLLAYGIKSGEVIVPSFSFISTANSVELTGARAIFADIEKDTLGLDSNDVLEKINKRTKAIIPMHYGGRVSKDIKALREIADDHNLFLIEDNAESLGAQLYFKFSGTFGHASMTSFCQNKIISTGEGGAIITRDKDLVDKLRLIRSHGRAKDDNYFSNINESKYISIGYNFRIPTMNAALGISQLKKIESMIIARESKGLYYDELFSQIPQIKTITTLNNQRNVYQLYSIIVNEGDRDELQRYLLKNNIYSKVYFHPIHKKSFYRLNKKIFLPNTEEISSKILSLPFSLSFTKKDQEYIVNKIKEWYNID